MKSDVIHGRCLLYAPDIFIVSRSNSYTYAYIIGYPFLYLVATPKLQSEQFLILRKRRAVTDLTDTARPHRYPATEDRHAEM
jgi:hypothetical protein